MSHEEIATAWDAVEDRCSAAENMRLRADLTMALKQHIRDLGWTWAKAAKVLGATQPRVSDLMRGKADLFAIDTLVNMLTVAGLRVEMQVAKAA